MKFNVYIMHKETFWCTKFGYNNFTNNKVLPIVGMTAMRYTLPTLMKL